MLIFLFRLVAFYVAISVLRRVVMFAQGIWRAYTSGAAPPIPQRQPPANAQPNQPTTLRQDPVCGTYVAIDTALKRVANGQVVYFCSDTCRDKYRA